MSDDLLELRELLNKTPSDFPSIPDLPAKKTFFGKITSISAGRTNSEKATPYFDIGVRLIDPGKDVTEAEIKAVRDVGCTFSDYDGIYARFWLTPGAVRAPRYGLRAFVESLGLALNQSWVQTLKLDPQTLNPTEETQEILRGRDVLCITPAVSENGRVFRQLDSMAGVKRD